MKKKEIHVYSNKRKELKLIKYLSGKKIVCFSSCPILLKAVCRQFTELFIVVERFKITYELALAFGGRIKRFFFLRLWMNLIDCVFF